MIHIEFVPLDAGKSTIGPFRWKSFTVALVKNENRKVFKFADATGFGDLVLPDATYNVICRLLEVAR